MSVGVMALTKRRVFLGSFALATFVLLGAVAALTMRDRQGGDRAKASAVVADPFTQICSGREATLDEARAALVRSGVTFLEPDTEAASSQVLRAAWICSDVGDIALQYETGVVVYEGPTDISDPAKFYAEMVASAPDEGSVGAVKGVPAQLTNPDASRGAEGGVDFVLDRGRYIVSGDGVISLERLIAVAESLHSG